MVFIYQDLALASMLQCKAGKTVWTESQIVKTIQYQDKFSGL